MHSHIAALPEESPLRISAITLGEIEYGHRAEAKGPPLPIQKQFHRFVRNIDPMVLRVGEHTAEHYGILRAALFEKYAPKDAKRKIKRPEQLIDPITSKELGIQENDLWICAQALEHRLVLVTHDKKMVRLHELAPELEIEDWASL